MKKESPELRRIAGLEHALEVAMYWLLRAHDCGHREGWEPSPNTRETMDALHSFLCNHDLDPCISGPKGKNAKALRRKGPEFYHFELERAVTRAVK